MTRAKHLYGQSKTDATAASFRKKLGHMVGVLKAWKKQGFRDEQYWPRSLRGFAKWDNPEVGIFSWSSTNVTKREGNYSKLVKRYWKLQETAKPYLADRLGETREKRINVRLATENARLLWTVMELRDALARADPNNAVLTSIPFP